MSNLSFKSEDREKLVEFLNFIAKRAKFDNLTIQETIDFVKLLTFMQKELIPKIESHILEVVRVVEPSKETPPSEEPKKTKGKK